MEKRNNDSSYHLSFYHYEDLYTWKRLTKDKVCKGDIFYVNEPIKRSKCWPLWQKVEIYSVNAFLNITFRKYI